MCLHCMLILLSPKTSCSDIPGKVICQEYEAQLAALKKQKEDQAPNPINGKMFLEPEVY